MLLQNYYANIHHLQPPDVPLRGAQVSFLKTAPCGMSVIVRMTAPITRERTHIIQILSFSFPFFLFSF